MKYLPNSATPSSKYTGRVAAAVAAVLLAGGAARGANTTYTLPNASAANWETAAWTLAGGNSLGLFPNAAGDIAQYLGAADATTVLDRTGGGAITVGKIVVGGAGSWTIGTGSASGLVFDNTGGTGNAAISNLAGGILTIAPNILLQNSNLDISTGSNVAGTIKVTGAISGTGDVSLSGARGATVITLGSVNNSGTFRAEVSTTGFTATTFVVDNLGSNVSALTVGNAANTFGGTLNLAGSTASTFTGPITIQGAANLRTNTAGLNGASSTNGITFGTGGGTLTASGGAISTAKAITLSGAATFATSANNDITLSGAISGAGGLTKTGLGNMTLSGSTSNTYLGDTTVVGGAFAGAFSLQKTGGAIAVPGDLIMDGAVSGNSAGIGTGGNTVHNQFGQQFGANSVIRFVNNTASVHAYFSLFGNDQTVAGISESVPSGGIIQNSQTEPFSIDSTLTINNSADFSFAGYLRDVSNTGTGRLGITKTGAGKQTLSGDKISYSGLTTINAGTLELVNATLFKSAVTFGAGSTGTLQIGSSTLTVAGLASIDVQNNSAIVQAGTTANATLTVAQNTDSSFGGVLRDNGARTLSLVKTGNGILTLAGNNTYTGATTLTGGKVALASANALGASGTINFNGGGLQYTAANTTDYSARFNNVGAQAIRVDTNGQSVTFASNLTSSGTLTKEGAGTLILSGANTYTGVTTINEGVLQAGSTNAIAGSSILAFASTAPAGTTFRLNGFNVSVGNGTNSGLSSASANAVIENGHATTDATFTVLSGSSNTYAGILQDGGAARLSFTRGGNGSGTLTLTGANTYTGVTMLNSGTLAVSLLTNGGQASGIGASSAAAGNLILNGGVLSYAGSGAASTNRSFTLGATGGLDASGVTAADTVTFTETGAFSFLAGGARTFTLRGSNTGNNTFAGLIADSTGATSLTKNGAGKWILTNNQTYTGATTISGGRLIINGTLGATAVTVAGGALGGTGTIGTAGGATGVTLAGGGADTRGVIDLTDGAIGTLTIRGAAATNGLTLGDASSNSAGLIFEIGSGGAADTIAISTAKLLVNSGGARVDIAGLSGFGLGTYNLLTFDNGQASGLSSLYLGTTAGGGYSYSLVRTATAVQLLVSAAANSGTWNLNNNGNWFTGGNWTGGIPNGTGASATFGSVATAARVVTLDQSATVGSLTFSNAITNAYTIAATGGSSLTLNNNGAGASITVSTGSHTISAPVFLAEATTVAVNGTGLTVSGIIGGSGRLIKTGTGTLILGGANTYSGGTTIRNGMLQIATEKQLGAIPTTFTADNIILDGGILRSQGVVTTEATRGIALTSNGGTIRSEGGNFTVQGVISDQAPGAGALTITGGGLYVTNAQSTYAGGTILTGTAVPQVSSTGPAGAPTSGPFGVGTLTFGTGSKMRSTSANEVTLANNVNIAADVTFIVAGTNDKNLTFTGGVTLSGGTRTLTVNPASANNQIIFLGAINDGGNNYGLIKADNGTLVLGGANTFTGGVTVNAGTLIAQGNAGALGGAGSGVVRLGSTSGAAAATLLVGDTLTYANPITVQAGSSGITTIGTTTTSTAATVLSGAITLNKGLTLASSGTGSLTLSGAITGSSAIRVTGSTGNFVQLSGNNAAYTGNLTVDSGTLKLGATTAISVANTAAVSSGATLELNGFDATLAGLTDGTGGGIVNNAGGTVNTLAVGGTGAYAYSGKLTATTPANLALTKTGSGTLTLSGLSTYTGATTVNGGTLILDLATNTTGVLAAASKLTLGGGTLTVQGATTGTSAQTLGDLSLVANTTSKIVIDPRSGSGTTLTLGNNWSRGTGGNALFIDLSSGNATVTSNPSSLLANGILSFVVVKDATGTGFGTISAGNIVRAAGDALQSTSTDGTKNYITKVGDTDYLGGTTLTLSASPTTHTLNSLTIDTSGGAGALALGSTNLTLTSNTLLVTGANNFAINGGTLGAGASFLTVNQAGTGNLTIGSAISGAAGGLIKLGTGTLTLSGTNTYTGATTINEGTLAVSGGAAISNSSTVTIADAATAVLKLNASEGIAALAGGGSTGGSVDLGSSTLTMTATTGTTTFSGVISGAGAVTKTGAGTQILAGANTYSGLTTVGAAGNSSILRITNGSALGASTAGTVVLDTSRLELAGGITVTGENLTITGNGGANNQGGLQSSVGTNTWTGTVTLGATDTRIGASLGATLIISGSITDGPNSYRLGIRTADGVGNTVVLSGVSDYGGGTDIVVGTLKIADGDNRLPTDTYVRMGNINNVSESRFDLNGWNQQIGGLGSIGTLLMGVTSAAPATLTIANTVNSTFVGSITGALAITKSGTLTQTFGGTSSYTGATTINAGVLATSAANALSNASAVSLANVASARLDLAGFSQTIGSLAGGGTTGGNVALGSATLTAGRDNKSTVYSGVISGTNGNVVKEGTGTMALNGANTYTGTTTVKAGTLVVGGSISGSLATVGDVANGVSVAVLMGGNGAVSATPDIAGISAVTAGASVDPGTAPNTAGVLNAGTFSLTNSAHLSLQIGGATVGGNSASGYDRVNVTGSASASLSGGSIDLLDITTGVGAIAPYSILFLVVNNGGGAASTLPTSITLNGMLITDLSNIVISGWQFSLVNNANYDGVTGLSGGTGSGGNDIALIAVPEPGSWFALITGTSLLAGLSRFRRRRG